MNKPSKKTFRGKAQHEKTRASFRRDLTRQKIVEKTRASFRRDRTRQKIVQQWLIDLREARAAEQKQTDIATQLTIQLLEEYNEDKKTFRKKQSPKVKRLLGQFKKIYEAYYGAEAFALAERDYQRELMRQKRIFGSTSNDFKQEDLKA